MSDKKTINIPYEEYLEMKDKIKKLQKGRLEDSEKAKELQKSFDEMLESKDTLYVKTRNVCVGQELVNYGAQQTYRDKYIFFPVCCR